MKKMLSALLFASLFMLMGSSAYAKHSSSHDDCSCDDFSCSSSSSHVRFHGGTFIGTGGGVLHQYILEPDGTAYWHVDSNRPEVGTWEIKKNHILLTTIGFREVPVPTDSVTEDPVQFIRTTQKLKIRSEHLLELKHIVKRFFSADENPLKGSGTVFDNTKPKNSQLHRVKVNPSDLKVKE